MDLAAGGNGVPRDSNGIGVADSGGRKKAPVSVSASGRVFILGKKKMQSHAKSRAGCHACKNRKVKCQETMPRCTNCIRRGEECVYPTPPTPNTSKIYREQGSPLQAAPVRSLTAPGWNSEESAVVLESIRYYNKCVVPDLLPASPPFKREEISPALFCQLPQIFHRLLVVLSQTIRAVKDRVDPLSRSDLCRYRGLCLAELGDSLAAAVIDPYGIALTSVLMLMLSDMQISHVRAWSLHLEAARTIIKLRGGIKKCLDDLPGIRRLLTNFVVVDILTATTCNCSPLEYPSIRAQSSYLSLLPVLEEEIMSSVSPCPVLLLQTIARTNILRANSTNLSMNDSGYSARTQNFDSILASIEGFDADAWAARISNYGRTLPPRLSDCASTSDLAGLKALALCYKSTALLYLFLSSQPAHHSQLQANIKSANQSLSNEVSDVLDVASDNVEGPLHTQIWKLLVWPLLVYMYVQVGWGFGGANLERDLDRVRSTAMSMGSGSFLRAVELMDTLQTRRERRRSVMWEWDSGFDSRHAFVV